MEPKKHPSPVSRFDRFPEFRRIKTTLRRGTRALFIRRFENLLLWVHASRALDFLSSSPKKLTSFIVVGYKSRIRPRAAFPGDYTAVPCIPARPGKIEKEKSFPAPGRRGTPGEDRARRSLVPMRRAHERARGAIMRSKVGPRSRG